MGNNAAFTQFEATVIAAYDEGILSPSFLEKLGRIHEGSDIDSGGKVGTESKDGLDVEGVVIKTMGQSVPEYPDVPESIREWSEKHHEAVEAYWDEIGEKFDAITRKWGWR